MGHFVVTGMKKVVVVAAVGVVLSGVARVDVLVTGGACVVVGELNDAFFEVVVSLLVNLAPSVVGSTCMGTSGVGSAGVGLALGATSMTSVGWK